MLPREQREIDGELCFSQFLQNLTDASHSVKHKRWYVEEGVPGPFTAIVSAVMALAVRSTNDVRDYSGSLKAHKAYTKQSATKHQEDEKYHYHSAGVHPERSPFQSFNHLGKQLTVEVASCKHPFEFPLLGALTDM